MENGPFEDVFPIKNRDIPASYARLPGRVVTIDEVLHTVSEVEVRLNFSIWDV